MNVALGLKARSGWAALVVAGTEDGKYVLVDRRRVELVDEACAKQPFHAAEHLPPEAAREMVNRGIEGAARMAGITIREAIERERKRKNKVTACGVIIGNPMPPWSVEEVLTVHLRMHQAEGVLFRDALIAAAKECSLPVVTISEKRLTNHAPEVLGLSPGKLEAIVAVMGKPAGAPWGKDQKEATRAALVALTVHTLKK